MDRRRVSTAGCSSVPAADRSATRSCSQALQLESGTDQQPAWPSDAGRFETARHLADITGPAAKPSRLAWRRGRATGRCSRSWPSRPLLSLRLIWSNTAFQDEALYLRAGHLEWARWLHHAPIPDFPSYFSGAPVIYPPLGALADSIGGLAAARVLSLCFMLGVTSLLWATAGRLYGRRAALLAAGLFATLAGTQFLGAFATFDAMALFLLALAAWLGVRCGGLSIPDADRSSGHRWRHPGRGRRREVRDCPVHPGGARGRGTGGMATAPRAARGWRRWSPCSAPGSCWSARPSRPAAGNTGWASRASTLARPQSDVPVTTVLRSAYVWTSLILVLAVLGAVLASRGQGAREVPACRPGRRRLAGPGRASQAPHDGQPAEARGVRRLVRRDRGGLRDGAAEQGRSGPRVGAGHGAAHRRVHAVRLDGTGGRACTGSGRTPPVWSASSARRSDLIRATTWPKTTTSRPTTCAPKFPGRGGQARTTSATREHFRGAFLPGRDQPPLLLAGDPRLRGHGGHRHADHRGHAPRGRLLRAGPRRPVHHLGIAGGGAGRPSGGIMAVTEPAVAEQAAGDLPAPAARRPGEVQVLRQAAPLGVRVAARRLRRGPVRVRPCGRARLARSPRSCGCC